jgi:uncharacterized protein YecE (DUF72 family)
MAVRVGTSGYNYTEWRGSFYPAKFATAKMLPYYAERFGTVEINYTFYRMPSEQSIAAWNQETPAGFCFALKAPKRVTHDARLRNVEESVAHFLRTARGLGEKLGPILFQLPPNFRKDVDRLNGLLDRLPADLRYAFEFRHPSWFDDEVYERLRAANAALCVADTGEGEPTIAATADFGYLRLRDEGYTPADLERWHATLSRLEAGWRDTFVYFKHEESGIGPALARQLIALLDR